MGPTFLSKNASLAKKAAKEIQFALKQ